MKIYNIAWNNEKVKEKQLITNIIKIIRKKTTDALCEIDTFSLCINSINTLKYL